MNPQNSSPLDNQPASLETEALGQLTRILASALAKLPVTLNILPTQVRAPGLGQLIGYDRLPATDQPAPTYVAVQALRVEAIVSIGFTLRNTEESPSLLSQISQTLFQQKLALRQQGILSIQINSLSGHSMPQASSTQSLSCTVVYEFVQPPVPIKGTIRNVSVTLTNG